jgi:hypothetical protein
MVSPFGAFTGEFHFHAPESVKTATSCGWDCRYQVAQGLAVVDQSVADLLACWGAQT